MTIGTNRALHRVRERLAAYLAPHRVPQDIFSPYPTPKFIPQDGASLAMDWAPGADFNSWAMSGLDGFGMGQTTFMGYPALAELAQRPEYRRAAEQIASHMTRKWIEFEATSDDEGKEERLKQLANEFKRLRVKEHFEESVLHDCLFGRAHLFIDVGGADGEELATPIGAGDAVSKGKIKKGALKRLVSVEPTWCYAQNYDARNPLSPAWYNPEIWYVMQQRVHRSRLLTFVGRPVPDMLKPAYAFGGLSLTQLMMPYVDNWLRTRQSVSDVVASFLQAVLKTNLREQLQFSDEDIGTPGASKMDVLGRGQLFNEMRTNLSLLMLDKEAEDFSFVAAPLGGLSQLQGQSQEQCAAIAGIPLVFYLGITPSGLNASSEGEIQSFFEGIHARQEAVMRPNLETVFKLVQLNLWGEVDEDLSFKFLPLWSEDETEIASRIATQAQTDNTYVEMGVLWPEEIRERLANDPESPYAGLDMSKGIPEPPAPEMGDPNAEPEPDAEPDPNTNPGPPVL